MLRHIVPYVDNECREQNPTSYDYQPVDYCPLHYMLCLQAIFELMNGLKYRIERLARDLNDNMGELGKNLGEVRTGINDMGPRIIGEIILGGKYYYEVRKGRRED